MVHLIDYYIGDSSPDHGARQRLSADTSESDASRDDIVDGVFKQMSFDGIKSRGSCHVSQRKCPGDESRHLASGD